MLIFHPTHSRANANANAEDETFSAKAYRIWNQIHKVFVVWFLCEKVIYFSDPLLELLDWLFLVILFTIKIPGLLINYLPVPFFDPAIHMSTTIMLGFSAIILILSTPYRALRARTDALWCLKVVLFMYYFLRGRRRIALRRLARLRRWRRISIYLLWSCRFVFSACISMLSWVVIGLRLDYFTKWCLFAFFVLDAYSLNIRIAISSDLSLAGVRAS